MSSSKKSRDAGKKPSVFERLGSKPSLSSTTEDYCKQWPIKVLAPMEVSANLLTPTTAKTKPPHHPEEEKVEKIKEAGAAVRTGGKAQQNKNQHLK